MKETRELVDKIKNNTIEKIEIDNDIILTRKNLGKLRHPEKKWFKNFNVDTAISIDNNTILYFSGLEAIKLDLQTNKISSQEIKSSFIIDSVVSSFFLDKNHIVITDHLGNVSVLNLDQMKVETSYKACAGGSNYIYKLHKQFGRLYGLIESSNSIFIAADTPTFCRGDVGPKVVDTSKKISFGDIAIGKTGTLYLPYGRCNRSFETSPRSSFEYLEHGPHSSNLVRLIGNQEKPSFLVYTLHTYREGFIVYKGDDYYDEFNTPRSIVNLSGESVSHIEVLSTDKKLILVVTNKSTYVYDLVAEEFIAKMAPLDFLSFRMMSDSAILFNTSSDHYKHVLVNLYQNKIEHELLQVFNVLKENTSIKSFSFSRKILSNEVLESLYELIKARPDLELNLSENVKVYLKLKTEFEDEKRDHNQQKTILREELSELEKKIQTKEDVHNQDLLKACRKNNYKKVKSALSLGAKLDSKNEAGETPLLVCINNDAKKCLKFILQDQKHYPEVEIEHLLEENDFGGLKFILNYMDKSEKALKLIYSICEQGIANKDIKQLMLDNLLMLAAQFGKIEIAGFAMEHGANVNTHDFKHYTPLHKACENNQLKMVAFLLKRDCDTTIDAHHTNFKKNANYTQLTKQFGNSIPNQKDLHKKAVDLTTHPGIKEMIKNAEKIRQMRKD